MVEHTHPISSDLFHQDKDKIEQNHEELIQTLMSSYVKPGQIKNTLNEREGLVVSVNHVRYKMKQLAGPNTNQEKLNHFLKQVKDDGGNINVMLEEKTEEVLVLTVTTAKMRAGFQASDPGVVNLDTTYNFERASYKLNAVLYLNPTSGKGEVAQFCFMADECDKSYNFCFESLKQICIRSPPVFMVDKVRDPIN